MPILIILLIMSLSVLVMSVFAFTASVLGVVTRNKGYNHPSWKVSALNAVITMLFASVSGIFTVILLVFILALI